MEYQRLTSSQEPAIEELLLQDVATNLFLLTMLQGWLVSQLRWYGAVDGDHVRAVTLVIPQRLVVPFAPEPVHALRLGQLLEGRYPPCMMVGPRAACDAFWEGWSPPIRPHRWYDQRLYVATGDIPGSPLPQLRRAQPSELDALLHNSACMEQEDLGYDPSRADPRGFRRTVQARIRSGRTWVLVEDGELMYHINVGTQDVHGFQIGGTYVPPAARGRGIATAATAEVTRRLLAEGPRVTLHVNEANTPAVRVYERAGYRRAAPFRLATIPR